MNWTLVLGKTLRQLDLFAMVPWAQRSWLLSRFTEIEILGREPPQWVDAHKDSTLAKKAMAEGRARHVIIGEGESTKILIAGKPNLSILINGKGIAINELRRGWRYFVASWFASSESGIATEFDINFTYQYHRGLDHERFQRIEDLLTRPDLMPHINDELEILDNVGGRSWKGSIKGVRHMPILHEAHIEDIYDAYGLDVPTQDIKMHLIEGGEE